MAKLGFLGLGIMGGPMARRLMEAGHHVALWSKSPGKAERFAAHGGAACEAPRDVARQSEIVFLCVGNTAMSRQAILGEGGLVEGASEGLVIADCSTVSPSASRRIGEELAQRGIEFLDAPPGEGRRGSTSTVPRRAPAADNRLG